MSCNHDCKSCSSKCGKQDLMFENSEPNKIKKIIAVVSGKGGVGKSTVTSMLAIEMAKKGYKVGILDADITGPSIPKAFGITADVAGDDKMMYPPTSKLGIKIMSINLLIDDPRKPVLWRGPVLGNILKQFYQNVLWEDLDYLFLDMPPGTGDVQLTVFQSYPVDGVVIVSTPQDLVSMIVGKAVNMCKQMDIPIYGLVENMSYIECPGCGEKLYPFGLSKLEEIANEYELEPLCALPIDPTFNELVDMGAVENYDTSIILNAVEKLL